jgi:hypothetical protein
MSIEKLEHIIFGDLDPTLLANLQKLGTCTIWADDFYLNPRFNISTSGKTFYNNRKMTKLKRNYSERYPIKDDNKDGFLRYAENFLRLGRLYLDVSSARLNSGFFSVRTLKGTLYQKKEEEK